jgi:hypothetical protein
MLIQTDHVHGWPPTRCNFAWKVYADQYNCQANFVWKVYADQYNCQAWLVPIPVRGT